jgi:FtsH-binding integral membrane protein
VTFAPFAFLLIMQFGINKLSAPMLTFLFMLFATVFGISLSYILIIYKLGSIIACFGSAGAMFGVMAFMGYTTDKDLTSMGRLLMMGLIGMVISMFINFFIGSEMMSYIISLIGVAIFTGLTAYDTQVLKRIGAGLQYEGSSRENTQKLAIMGAMTLYLDFLNLFLFLLRLFGARKN